MSSPSTNYLESPRVILRYITKSDAANLIDLDSDPQVVRFISDGKPSSEEQVIGAIERIQSYYEKFNHKLGLFIAIEKSTEQFMGWYLLRPDKNNLENTADLELGYRLKAKFWGKGYATEVSQLLVQKAFKDLAALSVFATAMSANASSINVMKKVGLKFHANYIEEQFPGLDKNAVKYVLSREEWLEDKSDF